MSQVLGSQAQRGLRLTLKGPRVLWGSGGEAKVGVGGCWVEERDMEPELLEDVLSTLIKEYAKCFQRA